LPLSARARIEVYLPAAKTPVYRNLFKAFQNEFLETFGGCTVIRDIKGLYLSANDKVDTDKLNLIYADTPFEFEKHFKALSKYADEIKYAALEASEEESILIVVHKIYHSI
jgi:hypothetical protein